MKHLIETTDWSLQEISETLKLAHAMKSGQAHPRSFAGKSLALLFMNPSLRTRVSFIRAAEQLGGSALSFDGGKDAWKMCFEEGVVMNQDAAEHVKEAIPVLGEYCDFLGIRSFDQGWTDTVARISTVPFINLESFLSHPCQAFADVMTIQEIFRGKRPKITLTWVSHPKAVPLAVTHSFLLLASRMGWDITLARPEGFELGSNVLKTIEQHTVDSGGSFTEMSDMSSAVKSAHIIYAKSWMSQSGAMAPQNWTVSEKTMAVTDDAIFMHCLPVRRNVEVSDAVLDSPRSKVVQQAGNRLHAQKAILSKMSEWNS